ncbi:twin transmembrane helix small protein [Paracoccus tibetensis]|uniref:Hypoxia induced protein conserved region n=1 Tax=Paracoccus tibetensis TaxID=336292 RepID=A0A1G5J9G8_9RHOB|nr:twin transmembrane helix small protein [Paracoccus tibetensis]SCY84560.1 Hypoxia induced protein conserved region [Paracoccus tibetensis]
MQDRTLMILSMVLIGGVIAILLTGIGGFAKGGEFNRKHGNRMMRWRLYAQAFAIVVMLGYVWWRAN